MAATLAELAERFGGTMRGDPHVSIERAASLTRAGPRDVSFVADARYLEDLRHSRAGAVILAPDMATSHTGNALVTDNPHLCFARVASYLHRPTMPAPGVDAQARVAPTARIAASAWVGPFAVVEDGAEIGERVLINSGCYIGRAARIGDETVLSANVVLANGCRLGQRCRVHAGAVIGADGFGYARAGERWEKVPQLGAVIIGDDVEIGANTTIDRGALDDTVIGDGVKLDNQVHVAHNVHIGEHTAIAACVGIAGSTVIGRRCTVGGHIGIIDHLTIADDVHITAGSLVTSSIAHAGTYSSSVKAQPVEIWRRNAARLRHLDELARRVRQLETLIESHLKEPKI